MKPLLELTEAEAKPKKPKEGKPIDERQWAYWEVDEAFIQIIEKLEKPYVFKRVARVGIVTYTLHETRAEAENRRRGRMGVGYLQKVYDLFSANGWKVWLTSIDVPYKLLFWGDSNFCYDAECVRIERLARGWA